MRSQGGTTLKVSVSGVAVVCCVHDREKRQVTTIEQVAEIGKKLNPPLIYDPKIHHTFLCACCSNLFVSEQDEPRFCHVCQRPNVHALGGPLPDPESSKEIT